MYKETMHDVARERNLHNYTLKKISNSSNAATAYYEYGGGEEMRCLPFWKRGA